MDARRASGARRDERADERRTTSVDVDRPDAMPATIELLGVPLHVLTERELVERVLAGVGERRGGLVVTPNLDHLRRCTRDPEYAALVRSASLSVADGVPLVWASRLAGTPLPEAVSGSNLIYSLTAAAADRGASVFLLGGDPGTAVAAAEILSARYPGLRVAGCHSPPFGFERDPAEIARIESLLHDAQPDIVYVGLGSPKQERLAVSLRRLLPGAWWLGIGVSFSFVSGAVKRAPRWMQRCGLEWLHRLCSEPRRLARRYLVEGIPFGARLLLWAARRRLVGAR